MKKTNIIAFITAMLVFGSCVNHGNDIDDADSDGVADDIDQCKDTPKGETVDEKGCALNLKTYVPNDTFEELLIDLGYDDVLDDYVLTANINTIEQLSITQKDPADLNGITDLIGIEGFAALSELYIYAVPLSEFDISDVPSLTSLDLVDVPITSLEVLGHDNLERLLMSGLYDLETLNVGNNAELTRLRIIDVSLNGQDSSVNIMNISENPKLESIDIFDSTSPAMWVENNTALKSFSSEGAIISDLVLNNNEALSSIFFFPGCKIYAFNATGSPQLTILYTPDGELSALDISGFPELEALDVSYNPLTCIKVSEAQLHDIPEGWLKDDGASYAIECTEL